MNKDALMSYIKINFLETIDNHWNWELLNNIIDYAINQYDREEIIKFLMNIVPEVTYEEYIYFMNAWPLMT